MSTKALTTIADDLDDLAREDDQGGRIDPFKVRVAARRIRAQVEMIEQKLEDGPC